MLSLLLAASLIKGPTSSEAPYVLPLADDVSITSILTVGDSVNAKPDGTPYRLVGSPDGLGAFDNGDGTFTLLMNHELPDGASAVHAHGERGAFVSKWTIRKRDLAVLHGEDLIRRVATWDRAARRYNAPAAGVPLRRFCSATLATGVSEEPIFLNGEESVTPPGRAFAHLMDGTSYELPRIGQGAWENVVPNPASGALTIAIALDDTMPGALHVYVGRKQSSGNPVDRAGLTNGRTYGIRIPGYPLEQAESGIPSGAAFVMINLGDVEAMTAQQVEAVRATTGVTKWLRPEDGAWDPRNPRDFYFNTTNTFAGKSRLWRLRFHDLERPENGGFVEMLLDGTEGQKMLDNLTVRTGGDVLLQEDPASNARLARIWRYVPEADELTPLAEHDPLRFVPPVISEESSGIIDVSNILGTGWLLFVTQAPYQFGGELFTGGQLQAMRVPATSRRRRVRP